MTKNNGLMDKIRQLKSTAIIAAMFSIAIDLECINSAEAVQPINTAQPANAVQNVNIFNIPDDTSSRYNENDKFAYGLATINNMDEMLKWVDDFWTGHRVIYRGTASPVEVNKTIADVLSNLLTQTTGREKIKELCYGTTGISEIPGGQANTTYSFTDIIANNCDTADNLKRTLLFLHVCYHDSICGGEIEKIIKLFLCSDKIIFSGRENAGLIRRERLSRSERNYVWLVRASFFNHIEKHWAYYNPANFGQILSISTSIHNRTSGLTVYNELSPNVAGNAAMQAIDDLVLNADLSNLHIFVNNGRELSISTEDGFAPGEAYMIEMRTPEFSQHIMANIAIRNNNPANNINIDISQFASQPFNNNKRRANDNKTTISGVDFQKNDLSKTIQMFFKFTIPYNIVNAMHRKDNMGSFYVRCLFM